MFDEKYKDIVDYEDRYAVSNHGFIFSKVSSKILKTWFNNRGYEICSLCKNGKEKRVLIHRLVAFAFIKKPKNKNVINHKDHNPKNNKVNNLEWCDMSYNISYAIKQKRFTPGYVPGEKCGLSKLKNNEIKKIRELKNNGETETHIAKLFNVSQTTISRIINYKTWKHI